MHLIFYILLFYSLVAEYFSFSIAKDSIVTLDPAVRCDVRKRKPPQMTNTTVEILVKFGIASFNNPSYTKLTVAPQATSTISR